MVCCRPWCNLRSALPPFQGSRARSSSRRPCFHKPDHDGGGGGGGGGGTFGDWQMRLSTLTFSNWTEHFLQEKHFLWNSFPSTISLMSAQKHQ